ncbi:hypothetical protein PG997_009596 [Apiospora hydei]|uniref:Uncharacterized protein n=1 Tax=Apiospora hydei TaxID=1337664 RepID=A0ABR1VUL5_9PEZI
MPVTSYIAIQPQTLWNPSTKMLSTLVVDILLAIGALAFLILAASAAALQDRPVMQGIGPVVETAMKLGPTIFPILFAALIGRMLKNVGRYYVEKGLKLGTLWRLVNVRTMFDAAVNPVQFREISVVAMLLIVLWSLSPLGGQAVLRLVHHFNETSTETVPIRYLDLGPGGSLLVQYYYLNIFDGEVPVPIDYTFGSALLQNQKVRAGPRDNWGNVKIPRIERLDKSSADDEGWLDVPYRNQTSETYSSLMGIPIVGVPNQGTTNMASRCDDCEYDGMFGVLDPKIGRPSIFLGLRGLNETENRNASFTAPRRITFLSGAGRRSATPEERWPDDSRANVTASTTCAVTQSLVESKVRCEQGDCAVTAIRRFKTDFRNPDFTVFDQWAVVVLEQISKQFSRPPSLTQTSNLIEYFLNDTSTIPVYEVHETNASANETIVDLSQVPSPLLAERAAMVLNTACYPGDLKNPLFFGASTNAVVTHMSNVYKVDWAWVCILFLSATTLIVAGIIGIVLGVQAKAPDMFDPVIGLTYDNKHLDVAELRVANPLQVTERARLLSDVVVRLGDSQGAGTRGKIVFGTREEVGEMRRDKMYE